MINVKKIKNRLYSFDLGASPMNSGMEILSYNKGSGINELSSLLKKIDIEKGIAVTLMNYGGGLFFKRSETNGCEIVSDPCLLPATVLFSLNFTGLKRASWYKLTVKGRDTNGNDYITNDRSVNVKNELGELVLHEDFTNNNVHKTSSAFICATSNDITLTFSLGKIYISDIILDEIEIDAEATDSGAMQETEIAQGKVNAVGYGVFMLDSNEQTDLPDHRYDLVQRIFGAGICLFYDKHDSVFIIEKDNRVETFEDNMYSSNISIDININKIIGSNKLNIIDCSSNPSPNTRKNGYLSFSIENNGSKIRPSNNMDRLTIIVQKIK